MATEPAALVRILGYRETVSLDARHRFRLPDGLASALYVEQGRVAGTSGVPGTVLNRLAFYFVPGTNRRIFLYPACNIEVAIERFESPPAGVDPEQLRAARDYFYAAMSFVEADRQNRLQIPEHLVQHAGLEPHERQVVLVSHCHWLSIARVSVAADLDRRGREALDAVGPSVLDPVVPQQPPSAQDGAQ